MGIRPVSDDRNLLHFLRVKLIWDSGFVCTTVRVEYCLQPEQEDTISQSVGSFLLAFIEMIMTVFTSPHLTSRVDKSPVHQLSNEPALQRERIENRLFCKSVSLSRQRGLSTYTLNLLPWKSDVRRSSKVCGKDKRCSRGLISLV